MATAAVSSSLPPSLKLFCQDPPWRVSSDLFQRTLSSPSSANPFKKVEVLPTDPEWRFVFLYFFHLQPTNRTIKSIFFIYNTRISQGFEQKVSKMELEASTSALQPKWRNEEPKLLRQKAFERFERLTAPYTPFSIPWKDNPLQTSCFVKVLPLWHGTSGAKCNEICRAGFQIFGKHARLGKGGNDQSTDEGYFGSGIYFTTSARYAADVYSDKEHLLLGWAAMREPYPVVNDEPLSPDGFPQPCSDMLRLKNQGGYENYNAHYIPVVSANNANCKIFYPCPSNMEPVWDEIVVFNPEQTLCSFWIEMGVDLPMMIPLAPLNLGQLLDLAIKLADHPEIRKYYSVLSEMFKTKAGTLAQSDLPDTAPYTEDQELYALAQRLISQNNQINHQIANQLMTKLSLKPPLFSPAAKNLPPLSSAKPIDLKPPISSYYSQMTDKTISHEQITQIPMTEFEAAIEREPLNAILYCNLARALPAKKGITLLNRYMTQQKLHLKAIELDPTLALAYHGLACTLSPNERIKLPQGTSMNQQQLYLLAIHLNPTYPMSYNNLACSLPIGGTICLQNGKSMTQTELFLKAIELDPNNAQFYYGLARILKDSETIQLPDKTTMTRQRIFLEAIKYNPNFSMAYCGLALTLASGQGIFLLNGTFRSQQYLLLQAIDLDPNNSTAYHTLALTLAHQGTVQLLNGNSMTQQELYLKAIDLDPADPLTYRNLASTLPDEGSIQLLNGTTMTKQQLLSK